MFSIENMSAKDIRMALGHKMKAKRLELGMTQENLSKKIGIKYQQIQHYECGKSNFNIIRLFQISRALGVDLNYFLEYDTKYNDMHILKDRKLRNLVSNFRKIKNNNTKLCLLKIIEDISNKN